MENNVHNFFPGMLIFQRVVFECIHLRGLGLVLGSVRVRLGLARGRVRVIGSVRVRVGWGGYLM